MASNTRSTPADLIRSDEPRPEGEKSKAPAVEESQIVHRINGTNEKGEPVQHVHGPMPVSEWAAYEKEHNL